MGTEATQRSGSCFKKTKRPGCWLWVRGWIGACIVAGCGDLKPQRVLYQNSSITKLSQRFLQLLWRIGERAIHTAAEQVFLETIASDQNMNDALWFKNRRQPCLLRSFPLLRPSHRRRHNSGTCTWHCRLPPKTGPCGRRREDRADPSDTGAPRASFRLPASSIFGPAVRS